MIDGVEEIEEIEPEEIEAVSETEPELTDNRVSDILKELKKELFVRVWTDHYASSRLPFLLAISTNSSITSLAVL